MPRVPRPVPSLADIPLPSSAPAAARPTPEPALPSVLLAPELEAQAQRRAGSSLSPLPARDPRLGDDAETALIPRALLDAPGAEPRARRSLTSSQQAWLGLITVGAVAAALVTLASHLKQRDALGGAARPSGAATSAPAASPPVDPAGSGPTSAEGTGRRIHIESEPPGALLVYRGAVIGTTPTDVPAPSGNELYLLRMAGHHSQLVQLSAASDARMVVVMQAELANASTSTPARTTP